MIVPRSSAALRWLITCVSPEVGEPGPAEGAGGAAGRGGLVVDHEGERPGLGEAGEELGVVGQAGDDPRQKLDLLVSEAVLHGHAHGLGLEYAAMLAGTIVEPHADEAAIVADRAVEPVPTHVDLGLLRQLEIGHRLERAVGLAAVDCRAGGRAV